jgi:hypothetical protein
MLKIKIMTIFLAVFILASCSGIRVNQDYDLSTVFSQYHTFTLHIEPLKRSGYVLMDSPLMDQRIRNAIENTLISKGYPKVTDTLADFCVTYQIVVRTRIEADTVPAFDWGYYPYGYRHHYYYPYWSGFGYETYVRQYEEATFIVDFMDSKTNKLFWRGVGSRRISQQSSPEKTTDWINQVIWEILAQYPPLLIGM